MSELEKKDHTAEDLPIYVRCLTLRDIDPCTELEAQGFGPEERASKEKVGVPDCLYLGSWHGAGAGAGCCGGVWPHQ